MADEMKPSKPQAEIDAVRAKMDELAERAKTDTAFVNDLKADTLGTLVAAGIDESAARETVALWQDKNAEVEGHYGCGTVDCLYWTWPDVTPCEYFSY